MDKIDNWDFLWSKYLSFLRDWCILIFLIRRGNKETFRRLRKVDENHRGFDSHSTICNTLRTKNFEQSVKLPAGKDECDWISMYSVEFYNQLVIFFGTIEEFCSKESCPHMCAGQGFKYLWEDGNRYTKPTDLPANQYISLLFDWADAMLGDPSYFPKDRSAKYMSSFKNEAKKILRRFLRVYAHIFHHHYAQIKHTGGGSYFKNSFRHFYYFVKEFDLIKDNEFEPLQEMIATLVKRPN